MKIAHGWTVFTTNLLPIFMHSSTYYLASLQPLFKPVMRLFQQYKSWTVFIENQKEKIQQ